MCCLVCWIRLAARLRHMTANDWVSDAKLRHMHFEVGVVARVRRVAHAFLVCHHGRETSDQAAAVCMLGVRCVLISGFNVHADAAWTSSLLCVYVVSSIKLCERMINVCRFFVFVCVCMQKMWQNRVCGSRACLVYYITIRVVRILFMYDVIRLEYNVILCNLKFVL